MTPWAYLRFLTSYSFILVKGERQITPRCVVFERDVYRLTNSPVDKFSLIGYNRIVSILQTGKIC